jgi:two-component system, OmpR family, sensor histidine kinase KdpD
MNKPSLLVIKFITKYLATIILLAAVTLILKLLEPQLEIQLIALLYLLPVLLSTVLWGLGAGLLSGLLSFLCFNFFFLQPYYTFSVHKTQDVITLFVFLIVAVVMSQLIGQAKSGVQLAKKREWEATKMYELIADLAGITNEQDILTTLRNKIIDTFNFKKVEINTKGFPLETMDAASLEPTHQTLVIPMETRSKEIGEIRLGDSERELTFEEQRLLHAFGYQGALAIERVHLFKNENKARVFEESDKLKTSLLNSISHELRSPLSAIKASISSLRSGAVDWETTARTELLATVDEETDQLNLLVGNLLDMSRIEAGALLPKKQWNSISEIISGVVTRLSAQVQKHDLVLDLPGSLPLVATDYVMMEQVFTNLISNSVKYAPAGTPIIIKARNETDALLIQVINQSPPVPEEHLQHIFDKFFRITKSDKVTGTGLGLSICKGIIEAHGGKIWAENTPVGFCFNISLPLTLDGLLPRIPEDVNNG